MNRSTSAAAAQSGGTTELPQPRFPAVSCTHWCHDYQAEVSVIKVDDAGEIKCKYILFLLTIYTFISRQPMFRRLRGRERE